MSQSNSSSSLRICSLSCLMSLDLSKMLEFTLKTHTHNDYIYYLKLWQIKSMIQMHFGNIVYQY